MSNEIKLTEEELKIIEILEDPIKWAEALLSTRQGPFKAREYQQEVINHIMGNDGGEAPACGRNRIVLRWGRRLGKCNHKDALVVDTKTGKVNTIEELYQMQKLGTTTSVCTLNNDNFKYHTTDEILIEDNGIKPCYKLTTKSGRSTIVTGNHPFLTLRGWTDLDNLTIGDRIAVPSKMSYFGTDHIDDEIIKFLAYSISDGHIKTHISFSNINKDIVNEYKDIAKYFGVEIKQYNNDYRMTNQKQWRTNPALDLLRKEKLHGHGSYSKFIPNSIFSLPKEKIALFLNRMYACDGWASLDKNNNRQIGYCTASEQMAKQVQHLLIRFGISAYINEKETSYSIDGIKNKFRGKAYTIYISDIDGIKIFHDEINIFTKEEAVEKVYQSSLLSNNSISNKTLPIEIWEYIEQERKTKGLTKTEVASGKKAPDRNSDRKLHMEYAPTKDKVRKYGENLKDQKLIDLVDSDTIWEPIVSIEYIGEEQTYSMAVTGTHNHVIDDIVSHNSTIMAVFMLWYCFTHKNGKIVVAAPYDSHVALIFKMIREFIEESPSLQGSVARDTKNPHYIELMNGSSIAGFTSGTRSGAKGDSIRGQAADWIILDEMDRLDDDSIDSIAAIALEDTTRIGIWASSTPTGRRGKFYNWCNSPDIWWHSHRPSSVNPTWTDRAEKEFRAMLSAQGYEHEIEAEWGEESTGVFSKSHIDRAKYDYQYLARAAYPAYRIMGVDWDKYQAVPQIVITEFDPDFRDHTGKEGPKFKIVHRSDILKDDFTLDNAVREIISLNDKFFPNFIYCDRGFGEYQIEMLRKHGMKFPETGLAEKVKGIQFSEKIPIRDPATKEIDKKDVKPFMVNQTVILMERDQIAINKNDEMVWRQMENYQVLKTTVYGRPIYTSEDEHALDAFMLSILGFTLEFPNITQILQEFIVARHTTSLPRLNKVLIRAQEDKDDFWDKNDPEETSYRAIQKDKIITTKGIPERNASRTVSWNPRGTTQNRPKSRKW